MNVAVRSAQHSKMFGHPADSHTVCRSRSRTSRFTSRNPSPKRARTRIHSGRAPAVDGATPACASRPSSRTGAPDRAPVRSALSGTARHRIARERREVGRELAPHDVLALDVGVAELLGEPGDDAVDDVAHVGRAAEHARERGHALVADAARNDVREHREIGIDVEREPVAGAPVGDPHADRRDLLVADPHAGEPVGARSGLDTEIGERGDEHRLEPAHVRDDVALAGAPLGERDDRVADELPGPVVGDVAAAVGPHELGAHRLGRHEHVGEIGARPERVHVRVLLQEQVVVGRARVQPALQRLGLAVRHPPQPATAPAVGHRRPLMRARSCSQSWVSSTWRTESRKAAAYAPSNARWSQASAR